MAVPRAGTGSRLPDCRRPMTRFVRGLLQLMGDRALTVQATVEFEYPIPAGSTRMAEIENGTRLLPHLPAVLERP
jgi:hypothetical protein